MSDAFDSEVQRFVSRQNGGDLTPKIVYQMLQAVHSDMQAGFKKLTDRFEHHEVEAMVRDNRIEALERFEKHAIDRCAMAIHKEVEQAIVEADKRHEAFHEATFGEHMEEMQHLTKAEFDQRIKERDELVAWFKKMDDRHREGDPPNVDVDRWRPAFEGTLVDPDDSELDDIRRVWRTARWFVAGATFLVLNHVLNI